ncbi:PQQ-binding-like beta-propeller repeat protein [Haloferax namakaokahaiae]|uniref:PQQ-binding-like beta-propeller repeat protein n=1 Tax=Haloferax namakaokahaiae TaxID=1748331 RepID=A0ABD5ZGV0_9EURY
MPSRRAVLSSLVAGLVPITGCGSSQRTVPTGTTDARTTTTRSFASDSSRTTDTATPEETPQDVQCDNQWAQDDVWRFDTTRRPTAATTDSKKVYVATEREIFALGALSGERRWRASNDALAEGFTPAKLLATEKWVLCIGYRHAISLDRESGQRGWVFEAPGKKETVSIIEEATALVGKTLFVGIVNLDTPSFEADEPYSRIYSFDTDTGTPQIFTQFTADGSRLPIPRYLDGNQDGLFCSMGGKLVALTHNGSTRWQTSRSNPGYQSPAVSDERVLASTREALVAFETTTGERVWQDEELRGELTITDCVGYATSRTIPEGEGQLTAFDPDDGRHHWEAKTRGRSSTPVISDEGAFVAVASTDDEYLTAFDTENGCRLGRFSFDSGVAGTPIVGSNRVTIQTGSTRGSTFWSFAAP